MPYKDQVSFYVYILYTALYVPSAAFRIIY